MAGLKPMPQELDAAADTLSLYMVARAGYSVDQAYRFWERLAARYPASVLNGYTALHPATAYRLAVMEKIIIDVKSKEARKQPLLP
jgi:predicted Zn-dependent protease